MPSSLESHPQRRSRIRHSRWGNETPSFSVALTWLARLSMSWTCRTRNPRNMNPFGTATNSFGLEVSSVWSVSFLQSARRIEQQYERHYDSTGKFLNGSITYEGGWRLEVAEPRVEPSKSFHWRTAFIVHYVLEPVDESYAFCLIAFDRHKGVIPGEYVLGPDLLEGTGATYIEMYRDIMAKLLALPPGDPTDL